MEGSLTAAAPFLLRKLFISILFFLHKSLYFFPDSYKLLQLLRHLLLSSFFFCIRLLPSLFFFLVPDRGTYHAAHSLNPASSKFDRVLSIPAGSVVGNSGIERALSQLLSIMNDIPASSRKYEVVRSLAEKIIDENIDEQNKALREINLTVLSAAFSRTLGQFETAVYDRRWSRGGDGSDTTDDVVDGRRRKGKEYKWLKPVLRTVRYCGGMVWGNEELNRSGTWPYKLGAELLWLARKLVDCGSADDAVACWASATNLAWLGPSAEPRIQSCLIKLSAFLFRQAKELGKQKYKEDMDTKEQSRQLKMKMLITWLPFFCRATNGTEEPVLNSTERAEMERILEETIDSLEESGDQEQVLALWLHHFTYCTASDWPNLHCCYARWCRATRKLFLQ